MVAVTVVCLTAVRHLVEPLTQQPRPIGVHGFVVADAEAAHRAAAGSTTLVRDEDHLHTLTIGDEGQLDLGDPARALRRWVELDLLMEGKFLPDAVEPARLEFGRLEVETELPEGVEHRVL
jgi:hypothetical protein